MKIIAEKFRMAKILSKRDLATAIAQKLSTMETINQLQVVLATPNATFRRDKNTIPRILNILEQPGWIYRMELLELAVKYGEVLQMNSMIEH
jgi:hypothetical protein